MLSIDYISGFLNNRQEEISKKYYDKINIFEKTKTEIEVKTDIKNKSEICKIEFKKTKKNIDLPKSFNILFNKNIIQDFYYDNKIYKNTSVIFTLLNSLFLIGNEIFNLNDYNEKIIIMKDFLNKIDDDLSQKDLYSKFGYNKNKKFNKGEFQKVIKDAYQFKSYENLHLLKIYLADYLGINIYIYHVKDDLLDKEKSEYYLTNNYSVMNKFVPTVIMLYENEIYKPLLTNSDSSIIRYSVYKELLDNMWNYFDIDDKLLIEMKKNKKTNDCVVY